MQDTVATPRISQKVLWLAKEITNLRTAVLDTLEKQNLQCMVNQALEGTQSEHLKIMWEYIWKEREEKERNVKEIPCQKLHRGNPEQ